MSKYRSCHSIEGEIFFDHLNTVKYCCMLTPNGGQPILYENYMGELLDWNEFFKKRDEHISLMKNGSEIPACKGCLWIKDREWDERKNAFKYILLNMWVKCNLKCIYCSNHTDLNVLNNTKEYDIIPVLEDMIEKGVLTPNTKIDIAGGESTLDPNFDKLITLLNNNRIKDININTNATIYSQSVQVGIEKGFISLISSIDSGTKSKFFYIKKLDLWNKVWKNLSMYSKALNGCAHKNSVRTKYIIIPNVNDEKVELLKFILKSYQAKVSGTILSSDLNWILEHEKDAKTMENVISLSKYYIKISKILKMDWTVWAHIENLIRRYNLISKDNQVDLSFMFDKSELKETISIKIQRIIFHILAKFV